MIKSLTCVDALSDEAVVNIMNGLSKCSVSKFQTESTTYHSVKTSTTYSGGNQTALSAIVTTLSKATDLYNSLSTGNN